MYLSIIIKDNNKDVHYMNFKEWEQPIPRKGDIIHTFDYKDSIVSSVEWKENISRKFDIYVTVHVLKQDQEF